MMKTTDNSYTYITLTNGLRMVHVPRQASVEYCGVAVRAGSRDDGTADTFGLAHFVEHTIFKGTARRRSWHIINRMETIGGELNAYTSEETTVVYSLFPTGNLDRATELIADLVGGATFPDIQIDRERDVILDEIDSYLDSPSESIFDDFNELIFAGSPLGHNILGTIKSVGNIDSGHCRSFLQRLYTPANMVFFYLGPATPDKVERTVSSHFLSLDRPEPVRDHTPPLPVDYFDITRHSTTHQAHTVMGTRVGSLFDPNRHALLLLNNIIGGPGMNSLLNVAMRERRGYVYTVDSALSLFSDCGLFTIYFGCDPSNTVRCRRLVGRILDTLADKTMTAKALDAAKKQFIGQLVVSSDNHEQTALGAGRSTLFKGHVNSDTSIRESIADITPAQLQQAAHQLTQLSVLTLTQ